MWTSKIKQNLATGVIRNTYTSHTPQHKHKLSLQQKHKFLFEEPDKQQDKT